MFRIEMSRKFAVRQGLPSPVRRARGIPTRSTGEPFEAELRIGFVFEDDKLRHHGWFIDTDELDNVIDGLVAELTADIWTETFSFRPTFELVSRWAYEQLTTSVPQLSYVELTNLSLGVATRYSRS
ncbi:6-carboxytetrahydropterin synthase [Nocardia sp. NPDC060256]|uniref:6-carboxytetrahydropterin synthase n=1 Tax=unclassified Nocardia TaxID=2637762 RepID=UPI003664AD4B